MPVTCFYIRAGLVSSAVRLARRTAWSGFRAAHATERKRVGCERPSTGSRWWGVAVNYTVCITRLEQVYYVGS